MSRNEEVEKLPKKSRGGEMPKNQNTSLRDGGRHKKTSEGGEIANKKSSLRVGGRHRKNQEVEKLPKNQEVEKLPVEASAAQQS